MPVGAAPSSRAALDRLRLHRAAARKINAHPDPTFGRAVGQGIRGHVTSARRPPRSHGAELLGSRTRSAGTGTVASIPRLRG
jgi:hypothetical protein